MKDMESWKKVIIFIVTRLFKVSAEVAGKVWDAVVQLVLEAKEHFPGPGQGDNKYNWVWDRLKEIAAEVKPIVRDLLIHWALAALESQGKKT